MTEQAWATETEMKRMSILDELDEAVAALGERVKQLEHRLQPVLSPERTVVDLPAHASVPHEPRSKIANVLNEVHRHSSQLSVITERLEV